MIRLFVILPNSIAFPEFQFRRSINKGYLFLSFPKRNVCSSKSIKSHTSGSATKPICFVWVPVDYDCEFQGNKSSKKVLIRDHVMDQYGLYVIIGLLVLY